mmetsp:Transcript_46678/g.77225  ORF Transcript_46678/g.77225 Transcript_46678/m.77225 type:complete len:343 (+) Transcript_46678:145-1173(+)|eukprot:CAMPEP_0119332852 /NCGR_PEP_ID=MMETSP1333-20130426/83770_1 /TAXON_ID=418940 /ORGANISM="Scyphosphaera apsteinii, Strain RCC1455" /LENGTH=342 /DNA_ID=CAMNT_0007342765 /DNA_START=139 /DNA_END=1167 /DNA_ORIENTATION=-
MHLRDIDAALHIQAVYRSNKARQTCSGKRCCINPLLDYPNLCFDGYGSQPFFHQINLNYPNLQLIHENPYIFVVRDFLCDELCDILVANYATSMPHPSATYPEQSSHRTSTTVYPADTDHTVSVLRAACAELAKVDLTQLEPAKLTCYAKGQFFRRHIDANFALEKSAWLQRMAAHVGSGGDPSEMTRAAEPCHWPARICTILIYLNDASEGGCTTFTFKDIAGESTVERDCKFSQVLSLISRLMGLDQQPPSYRSSSHPNPKPLRIVPKKGMAVVHFPATGPWCMCLPDTSSVHEAETAVTPKFIAQQFIWPSKFEPEKSTVPEVRRLWREILLTRDQVMV